MGARTDAARAEVLAARAGLDQELLRLEASGRAAVDIPARLRREPAKVLGRGRRCCLPAAGRPKRVFKGVRKAIFGPDADLPKSMLPKEVEKTLKKLGPEGERVRGTLEREFAAYLDEKAPQRQERDLGGAAVAIAAGLLKPVAQRARQAAGGAGAGSGRRSPSPRACAAPASAATAPATAPRRRAARTTPRCSSRRLPTPAG